jgi:hypothetical protein
MAASSPWSGGGPADLTFPTTRRGAKTTPERERDGENPFRGSPDLGAHRMWPATAAAPMAEWDCSGG